MSDSPLNKILSSWRQWSEVEPSVINSLTGGLTNQSYLIEIKGRKYVLRINAGSSNSLDIDRAQEVRAIKVASDALVAPKPFFVSSKFEFIVTEYVEGRVWTTDDLKFQSKLSKLARLLASIHALSTITGRLSISEKVAAYRRAQNFSYPELEKLEKEIFSVVNQISNQQTDHCLCHNDLLISNIIETEKGRLIALDWEYAAMGSPYFDLAVVIDGQLFHEKWIEFFLAEYNRASFNGQHVNSATLWYWRIAYSYLDCLWYTLQKSTGDSGPLESLICEKVNTLTGLLESGPN